jgi:Protein of unknown function (DUF3485)
MKRLLVLLAFAAIIGPAVAQGIWTSRWGWSDSLQDFVARLDKVPQQFEDWQATNLAPDPRQLSQSGLAGYFSRRYQQRGTKNTVFVLVAAGRPGPVAVHTPDSCYETIGYSMGKEGISTSYQGPSPRGGGDFQNATFMRSGTTGTDYLKIYWSWNASGRWQVPAQPRIAFAGRSALYKLYVLAPFSRDEQQKEAEEICEGFLRAFLPELNKALF